MAENLRGRAFLVAADDDTEAMASEVIRVLRDDKLRAGLVHEAINAAHRWNATQLENPAGVLQLPITDNYQKAALV
jgi:hypothetical protein